MEIKVFRCKAICTL